MINGGVSLSDENRRFECRRAENGLVRMLEMLEEGEKIAHLGSFEIETSTAVSVWSREQYRIYGLDPNGRSPTFEEMLQKCVHPEDAAVLRETLAHAVRNRSAYKLEHRIVRPDGSVRWVLSKAHPCFDDRGRLVRYIGTSLDITERKRAEKRKSISAPIGARRVFEGISDAFFSLDPEWRFVAVNPAAQRSPFARPASKLLGQVIWELYPDLIASPIYQHCVSAAKNQSVEHCEAESLLEQRWYEVFILGWSRGVDVNMRDITDRKRVETVLRESEERYRGLLENLPSAVVLAEPVFDNDGRLSDLRYVMANPAAKSQVGTCQRELVGSLYSEVFPYPTRNPVFDIYERTLSTGEPFSGDIYLPAVERWMDISVYRVGAHRLALAFTDVTERKRIEDELASAQARAKLVLEGIADTFFSLDTNWRFTAVNPAAEIEPFGRPASELIGLSIWELFPDLMGTPMHQQCLEAARRHALERHDFQCPINQRTYEVFARGWVCGVDVYMRDITERKQAEYERKKLEDQLQTAQKMEAVGTLAGGVVHDFNNILGGVMLGLASLAADPKTPSAHKEEILEMKELVQHAADLTKQLLGFARGGKHELKPLDLAVAVHQTAKMFGRTRADITIEYDFAPDLEPVLMDHAQLEQVLLNLLLNAGHAMPYGGRVHLKGENADVSRTDADLHGVVPGRFVRLLVVDTGCGMDEATQARIFEPFFTTKPPGAGSGLGLASVHGIVKNHGGFIVVESRLGEGASFAVFLPATDQPATVQPTPVPDAPSGHGTVLVVDDEKQLLKCTARLLRTMGYEVLTAPDGRSAVDLVRQHSADLALVILDMTMPEMSGADTFQAIREIAPSMEVLLSSGYTLDGEAQELLDRGCSGFIQKPFDAPALCEKIEAIRRAPHSPS
jgi:two-component system, cell cycle sensor histidine kinase and response regulator CckA